MPKTYYVSITHQTRLGLFFHQKLCLWLGIHRALNVHAALLCWLLLLPDPTFPFISPPLLYFFPHSLHLFLPVSLSLSCPFLSVPSTIFLVSLPVSSPQPLPTAQTLAFLVFYAVYSPSQLFLLALAVSHFPRFISSLCLSWAGQVWPLVPDSLGSGSNSAPAPCPSNPWLPLRAAPKYP